MEIVCHTIGGRGQTYIFRSAGQVLMLELKPLFRMTLSEDVST